ANFSLMTDNTVCISNVLHKTYLDVNENGTEAAAVTAVTITFTESVHPQSKPPFVMIIDHPFFCVIKDNITGLILFSGAIVDPKPNE
ncbi:MAG: serpin family protein, partial [Ignavibacteriaceae bacterium]